MIKNFLFVICLIFSGKTFPILNDGGAGWAQVSYLVKILGENIKRYQQLQAIIGQAREHHSYLRVIHSGLANSIGLLDSLPVRDERVLGELLTFKKSLEKVRNLYGQIPKSRETPVHTLHDQTVAESLKMVTLFKKFTENQEENSVRLTLQGRQASPKGAARMQVESNAQILKSINQLIRLNAQMLKTQSELMAFQNKAGKDGVARFQKMGRDLENGFFNFNLNGKLYRY